MYLSPNIITKAQLQVLTDSELYLLLKSDSSEGRITEARAYEASAISRFARDASYYIGAHTMAVVSTNWCSGTIAANPVSTTGLVVTYYDSTDQVQTLDAGNYYLEANDGLVTIKFTFKALNNAAPALFDRPDAVKISFNAGHSTATTVDPLVKHAIMQHVAYWFDKPEEANHRYQTSFDIVINNFRLTWI